MKLKPVVEKTVLSFRVTAEVRKAVEAAAAKDRRPVAHWLELQIEDLVNPSSLTAMPEPDSAVL